MLQYELIELIAQLLERIVQLQVTCHGSARLKYHKAQSRGCGHLGPRPVKVPERGHALTQQLKRAAGCALVEYQRGAKYPRTFEYKVLVVFMFRILALSTVFPSKVQCNSKDSQED